MEQNSDNNNKENQEGKLSEILDEKTYLKNEEFKKNDSNENLSSNKNIQEENPKTIDNIDNIENIENIEENLNNCNNNKDYKSTSIEKQNISEEIIEPASPMSNQHSNNYLE